MKIKILTLGLNNLSLGRRTKFFIATVFLILVAFLIRGQGNLTLKGIVVDKDGDPLMGCNVVIKGTTTAAVTDVCGEFSIPIERDDFTMVFHDMTHEDLRAFEQRLKGGEITADKIVFQIGSGRKKNKGCNQTIDKGLRRFRIE